MKLLDDISRDPDTTVVEPEKRWFDKGIVLFAARLDKKWSLTDCISFTVMTDMGLTDALTADGDFTQAGFRILMKPTP